MLPEIFVVIGSFRMSSASERSLMIFKFDVGISTVTEALGLVPSAN